MTGLMHSDISDSERVSIDMAEARKIGFMILPPDVNKSEVYFTIEKGNFIRFGLGAIKNVGLGLVESIVSERQTNGNYASLSELISRLIGHSKLNKKALECLIKVGALDKFGYRNQLLAALPQAYEAAAAKEKIQSMGQGDLFGGTTNATNSENIVLPDVPDLDTAEKIAWEKELIGSYITAHPLDKYGKLFFSGEINPVSTIANNELVRTQFNLQNKYRFLAAIANVKIVLTKSGGKPMAILELEDQQGKVDAVVFPKTYELIKLKLISGSIWIFYGNVSQRDDKYNLIVDELVDADSSEQPKAIKIDIRGNNNREELNIIKEQIRLYKGGDLKLSIVYGTHSSPKTIITTVKPSSQLFSYLDKYIVK
jgi:DNA polymerase-3 subunit alpha